MLHITLEELCLRLPSGDYSWPLCVGDGGDSGSDCHDVRGCIQKFPDWTPRTRIANGTALCH
jgi:hypothetical protein